MVERTHVLDAFVLEKMAETRLPGLSLSLVQHGEVRYARGFGFRDLERGIPATPSTIYAIGSLTKSFTCLALMQLQEQGRLSIDDPVTKYLPLTITPAGQPIRLWHLMTHTSGIPALAYAEAAIRQRVGAGDTWVPIATTADMLTFVNGAEAWVHCDPGTRWFYLNEGYVLLGAVIEAVTGRPYTEYVREAILAPLGMRRTWFEQSEVVADSDVAVPYLLPKDKPQVPSRYAFGQITSDGGLFSNMDDLVRYASMYLANGRGPSGPIASPQSIEAMMQPRIPLPGLRERGGSWEPAGYYGYGLSIYPDFLGQTMVGHGGSVLVSTAYMGLIPALGIGVVVAANGSGYPLQHVAACALAVAMGRDPWDVPALRLDRCLGALTGVYETYRGTFRAVVRRAGDFLALEVRLGEVEQIIPLVPESPSAMDVDTPRFFTLTGGHRLPVEFSVRGPDVELVYERYKFRRVGKT
jgi:CubicO group peptidase (beta-lactamase class C family)